MKINFSFRFNIPWTRCFSVFISGGSCDYKVGHYVAGYVNYRNVIIVKRGIIHSQNNSHTNRWLKSNQINFWYFKKFIQNIYNFSFLDIKKNFSFLDISKKGKILNILNEFKNFKLNCSEKNFFYLIFEINFHMQIR